MNRESDFEDLNNHLAAAARELGATTEPIRRLDLNPEVNCRKLAEALGNVFEIMRDVYEQRPDLMPDYMRKADEKPTHDGDMPP
jgi:hypothetical protein